MRLPFLLAALAALAAAMPSQTKPAAGGVTPTTKVDAPERVPLDKDGKPLPKPKFQPVVLPNRGPGRGDHPAENAKSPGAAAGHVRFTVACEPATVAPGGQGTLVVYMALAGNAVMLDPPPAEFLFERAQGGLMVVGEPRFRPAQTSGLAPALKGLPVYDDLAVLEVPFTVDAGAAVGSHPLDLAIRYELLDGQKGGEIGRFTDPIAGTVTVSPATVAPNASAPAVGAAAKPHGLDAGGDAGDAGAATVDARGGRGATMEPGATEPPVEPAGSSPEATVTSWFALTIAGALLAVILLLVAVRVSARTR